MTALLDVLDEAQDDGTTVALLLTRPGPGPIVGLPTASGRRCSSSVAADVRH